MVRTSTATDSQCVHTMIAKDIAKFTVGFIIYAWFAVDAFFNMCGNDKHPAVLAWLVLIPVRELERTLVFALILFSSVSMSLHSWSPYTQR